MTEKSDVLTVRFKNGRIVLAIRSKDILVPRVFKSHFSARKIIVSLRLKSWTVMKTKNGKFYATMKLERSVDPTPEQIEERKREVWRDHLQQKLDTEVVDPGVGRIAQLRKYLEIAHENTYHDVFNDVRTGHDKPTQFQCDCPYWEHERRNPEC